MDYFKDMLKKTGISSIIEAIGFAFLGAILIWKPNEIMSIIAYVIGAILIAMGVIKILSYTNSKNKGDLYNYELIYGVMSAVIGLIVILHSETISTIIGIIFGIWIIYSSVVRLSASLTLKSLESNVWIVSIIISVIMFILGLYIVVDSSAIVTTIGTIMIVYAVLDIIENIILIKNIK